MQRFRKPRKYSNQNWTKEEKLLLKKLIVKGLGAKKIKPYFKERSLTSIKSKLQKFKIKYGLYGLDDKDTKQTLAKKWIAKANPDSIFEGFAGTGNLTRLYLESGANKIYSCELNKGRFLKLINNISSITERKGIQTRINDIRIIKFNLKNQTVYLANCNAERLATYLYSKGERFDLVDLDPCGTALPSMYLFLRLIKNGYLEMTYGEFHSYRLGRYDVLLKTVPTAFNFSKDGITLKKISSEKDLYRQLISWTCLQGAFTLDYNEMKFVNPIESSSLGNRRMFRVLYKVNKADSLTKILNKSISVMKN